MAAVQPSIGLSARDAGAVESRMARDEVHQAAGPSTGAYHARRTAIIQQFMRDFASLRLPQFDPIEGEDRLLDEIQCDAGDVFGLFAFESLARRIDQGE